MPTPNTVNGDLVVSGQLRCGTIVQPAASVTDASVQVGANVSAAKLEQQHAITYRQKTGADVAAQTEDVYVVRGLTGSVVSVDVVNTTAPAGGDKAHTVDVQKGNQSTAFATVLTAPVAMNSTRANRQVVEGALVATPTLADGDTLRVVVATSGTTGAQGQGLVVVITVREKADP